MNKEILEELLSHVLLNADVSAELLTGEFGSLAGVFEADADRTSEVLSGDKQTAVYIKLCCALASRRGCDRLKPGRKYGEDEICEYLKCLFLGLSDETVYLLSLDNAGKVIACDRVGEGTVNFSSVLPRRVIDAARKRGARSVILAHNHPGGHAKPSGDDEETTRALSGLFSSSGIELTAHYVVEGDSCAKVTPV